ncbi:uncharacterized protein BJ212DRAFT_1361090, partial [Suillus subaureus]
FFAIRDGLELSWTSSNLGCRIQSLLSYRPVRIHRVPSTDEAIRLAAAMQFSGFRSVIDSMWSVNNEVARQIHLKKAW